MLVRSRCLLKVGFVSTVASLLAPWWLSASVIYIQPDDSLSVVRPDPLTFAVSASLDIAGNGDAEFTFENWITPLIPPLMWPVVRQHFFSIESHEGVRFLVTTFEEPIFPATYVAALPQGTVIGPDSPLWASGEGVLFYHRSTTVSPDLIFSDSQGDYLDQFGWNLADGPTHSGLSGYIGVEFTIDDDLFYGWVEVDTSFDGNSANGGQITRWAYNSIPGEPIRAGEVPEPATVALLAGIAALAVTALIRRRRQRRP